MSLSFRLSEVEKSIAYADVKKSFKQQRDKWLRATLEQQESVQRLAELTLELIDAFTPGCIAFLWPARCASSGPSARDNSFSRPGPCHSAREQGPEVDAGSRSAVSYPKWPMAVVG